MPPNQGKGISKYTTYNFTCAFTTANTGNFLHCNGILRFQFSNFCYPICESSLKIGYCK